MTSFASLIARGTDRVYARFGEPATYTDKLGASLPVVVVVERNLTQYGQVASVQGKTAVINVRVSEVASTPRRGDSFALASGEVLVVESLMLSDGIEHKMVAA